MAALREETHWPTARRVRGSKLAVRAAILAVVTVVAQATVEEWVIAAAWVIVEARVIAVARVIVEE